MYQRIQSKKWLGDTMRLNFLKNHFNLEITKYLKRFSFKATKHFGKHGFSLLFLFAKTQTLEAITSLIPNSGNKHIILADVENCSTEEVIEEAKYVQQKYGLSNFYIYSDAERSFRVFCYSLVKYKTLLKILLDFKHLDMVFFDYTVKRKKATLRYGKKMDRPSPKLVKVLETYPMPFPKVVEQVFYDTGVVKKGISFTLGNDD